MQERNSQPGIRHIASGILLGLVFCLLLPVAAASGADSNRSFESFHPVFERNIFNANRQASRQPVVSMAPSEPIRSEELFLIGSLCYGETEISFFESTNPEYPTIVQKGDTIAGFQVSSIGTHSIMMEKDGEHLVLPVGEGLRKRGDGSWEVISRTSDSIRRDSSTGSSSSRRRPAEAESRSSRPPQETGRTDSSRNDMLRRMMERRRQEMEQ